MTETQTAESILDAIAATCDYSETEDCGVDALIDYKNALEDMIGETLHNLQKMRNVADAAREWDCDRWEQLATGQDTQEAEASGVLAGQVAGLDAALKLMRGEGFTKAIGELDVECPT